MVTVYTVIRPSFKVKRPNFLMKLEIHDKLTTWIIIEKKKFWIGQTFFFFFKGGTLGTFLINHQQIHLKNP